MKEQLESLINELKSDSRLSSFDEASTKQIVLLRTLSLLGWNTYNIDEVRPEYAVGGQKVDYSLRFSNVNKVFIEVKRVGEDLNKHREQLLNYSFKLGVKLAVLTDGISWWFYLPLHEGSWEQRKFFTVEVVEQDTKQIVDKMIDFLSKDNVCTGRAVQNAEAIITSNQKERIIKEAIPQAWQRIIDEPDDLLVDILADGTEKICGYKPDRVLVEEYISSLMMPFQTHPEKKHRPSTDREPRASRDVYKHSGKSVQSFTFKGITYEVKYWIDILIKICDIINSAHTNNFDWVLKLKGRVRPYFTKNKNELRVPQLVTGSNIYMETNLSANQIVKICLLVISIFGYSESDFKIEVRN